jgi:hypothetical protein
MEKYFLQRIDNLKATRGSNAKKTLLEEYLTDELFLRAVQYTLDSRKHYNISLENFPEFKESSKVNASIDDVFKYLDFLANKRGCTDFEKDKLHSLACSSKDIYDITSIILKKSLDCGAGATTINAVRPDTVEIFPYMRCSTIAHVGKITYPAFVQEKLNGEYIAVIKEGDRVYHRTRNGSYLDLKGRFVQQFKECEYDNWGYCINR